MQNSGITDEQDGTILKNEYNKALEEMRKNKVPEVGNIPIELIQNVEKTVKEL